MVWDWTPIIQTVIYASIIIVGISTPMKIILNSKVLKAKADTKKIETQAKFKGKGLVATAMDLIETGDQKQAQINHEIQKLREQGVTDEQMGNLLMEKKFVDLACHPVAKLAGGPIIQIIAKTAKGFGIDV